MESQLSSDDDNLIDAARLLVRILSEHKIKIVFAESCTGGLVSATLTRIPGVSSWLCGSAVTYQEETKQAWLNVSAEDLGRFTAVSEQVTRAMAREVLAKTPQADLAVAVTGHLGPDAPPEIDGVVFVASCSRIPNESQTIAKQLRLTSLDRGSRQIEATDAVLRFAKECCNDRS